MPRDEASDSGLKPALRGSIRGCRRAVRKSGFKIRKLRRAEQNENKRRTKQNQNGTNLNEKEKEGECEKEREVESEYDSITPNPSFDLTATNCKFKRLPVSSSCNASVVRSLPSRMRSA